MAHSLAVLSSKYSNITSIMPVYVKNEAEAMLRLVMSA